jgi:hypothetical protein
MKDIVCIIHGKIVQAEVIKVMNEPTMIINKRIRGGSTTGSKDDICNEQEDEEYSEEDIE